MKITLLNRKQKHMLMHDMGHRENCTMDVRRVEKNIELKTATSNKVLRKKNISFFITENITFKLTLKK